MSRWQTVLQELLNWLNWLWLSLKEIWRAIGYISGWHALANYMHKKSLAPIFAAAITALAALAIAQVYTKRLKRIDTTLAFMRRFGELLAAQRDLNKNYNVPCSLIKDRIAGYAFFDRFFAEMLNQFRFFQEGLIRTEIFIEWTMWRWHDYHETPDTTISKTCGVSYREGWKRWVTRPVLREYKDEGFIKFLSKVHDLPATEGTPSLKELVRIVRASAPWFSRLCWWRW